jgi:hypothetical protein
MSRRILFAACLGGAFLGACLPSFETAESAARRTASTAVANPEKATPAAPEPTFVPQPTETTTAYGPDGDEFPPGINPLTGLPVANPDLLKIPAVLVSISHFPPSGRPQAGLSFAPFVYEFSITRGETRFLAAFHGRFPEVQVPVKGECSVRSGAFVQAAEILGNRVWLDSNSNGVQDPDEEGIPGICVQLQDAQGVIVQRTTTDTNGMYGFNVEAGQVYRLQFLNPAYLDFAKANEGFENLDSDADPQTGITGPVSTGAGGLDWDAGMTLNSTSSPAAATAELPAAEVGPVRSGRLLYAHLGTAYTNSCLIYAYADPTILAKLPHCAFVSHEDNEGGEAISIERMQAVAEDNMRHTADRPFSYASNRYSETPPSGGLIAERLNVYFNRINQSAWVYDPLYRAYLRLVDNADAAAPGVLHPDVDRLTARQLHFENVIIVMVDTDVVTRTNLDIRLDGGNTGPAKLFRDGRVHDITWSTRGGEYEKKTGVRRPIQFLNADGTPAVLRPGHTWVILVTPFSYFDPEATGIYRIKYAAPAGEAQ